MGIKLDSYQVDRLCRALGVNELPYGFDKFWLKMEERWRRMYGGKTLFDPKGEFVVLAVSLWEDHEEHPVAPPTPEVQKAMDEAAKTQPVLDRARAALKKPEPATV